MKSTAGGNSFGSERAFQRRFAPLWIAKLPRGSLRSSTKIDKMDGGQKANAGVDCC